jgi:hypothetical protein
MGYISVEVDIDIDLYEIDTDDLVEEICRRLKSFGSKKSLSDKEKKDIKESLSDLEDSLNISPVESIEIKTLDDKMKVEHFSSVFYKYTSSQIENLLP